MGQTNEVDQQSVIVTCNKQAEKDWIEIYKGIFSLAI